MSVSPLQPPSAAPGEPGGTGSPSAPPRELERKLIESVAGRFEIVRLPATPLIIDRALRASQRGGETSQVCEWLELDPVLTLRLLDATVDAPANVHAGVDALSLAKRASAIDPGLVRSMLLSAARTSLGLEPASLSARELGEFWIHALRVAFLTKSLAEACAYRSPDEAYLVGLLHDLGSLALLATVPNTLRSLVATQANASWGAVPEYAGRLGTIHAQVGAALLEKLQVPFYVSDAVLLHHVPPQQLEGAHPVVRILCCAEALLNSRSPAHPLGAVADLLGISATDVSSAEKGAAEKVSAVLRGLGRLGLAKPRNAGQAPQSDDGIPASGAQQRLTETLVMRFVTEAEQPSPGETPLDRKAAGELAQERVTGEASSEGDGWAEALALQGTNATANSILDQVAGEAIRLEAGALVRSPGDVPRTVADLMPLARVVAGIKSAALFLGKNAQASWPGWLVGRTGAARIDLELLLAGGRSLVARAAREGETLTSYQEAKASQLSGVDLQIARMLEAEEIAAIPMGTGTAAGPGVLVFGTSAMKASRFAHSLSFLTELTELVARSATSAASPGAQAAERGGEDSLTQMQAATRRLVHEARNPLSVLKTYLQIARTRIEGGQSLDKELEIANQEVERVARVLDEIGKPQQDSTPRVRTVELNCIIEDLLALYGDPLFGQKQIVLSPMLDESILPISCDEEGLKQVLLNLLINASEALSSGDQVMVCTSDYVNYEGRVMVEISVADNGPGMSPEKIAALFAEPEAEARESARGLGLPTSLAVVKSMGGHLLCRSRLGEGSTFAVLLPRTVAASPPSPNALA
jgi:signal transduction histidine kinase/HD-like signal output (HDOD) protein